MVCTTWGPEVQYLVNYRLETSITCVPYLHETNTEADETCDPSYLQLSLIFLRVLEPFDKLLHMFEENTITFGQMSLCVPLEDGVLTYDIGCEERTSTGLE